jgi:hypothetical protein
MVLRFAPDLPKVQAGQWFENRRSQKAGSPGRLPSTFKVSLFLVHGYPCFIIRKVLQLT